eukprot:gene12551-16831_t
MEALSVFYYSPTAIPTIAPSVQTKPIISFLTDLNINGLVGTYDINSHAAIAYAIATTLSVPTANVEYYNTSNYAAYRRLNDENIPINNTYITDYDNLEMDIKNIYSVESINTDNIVMQGVNYYGLVATIKTTVSLAAYPTYSNGGDLYYSLTTILSASVASGSCTTALQKRSKQLSVNSTLNGQIYQASYYSLKINSAPTFSPTPSPTTTSKKNKGMSTVARIGLLCGMIVIIFIILANILFFIFRRYHKPKPSINVIFAAGSTDSQATGISFKYSKKNGSLQISSKNPEYDMESKGEPIYINNSLDDNCDVKTRYPNRRVSFSHGSPPLPTESGSIRYNNKTSSHRRRSIDITAGNKGIRRGSIAYPSKKRNSIRSIDVAASSKGIRRGSIAYPAKKRNSIVNNSNNGKLTEKEAIRLSINTALNAMNLTERENAVIVVKKRRSSYGGPSHNIHANHETGYEEPHAASILASEKEPSTLHHRRRVSISIGNQTITMPMDDDNSQKHHRRRRSVAANPNYSEHKINNVDYNNQAPLASYNERDVNHHYHDDVDDSIDNRAAGNNNNSCSTNDFLMNHNNSYKHHQNNDVDYNNQVPLARTNSNKRMSRTSQNNDADYNDQAPLARTNSNKRMSRTSQNNDADYNDQAPLIRTNSNKSISSKAPKVIEVIYNQSDVNHHNDADVSIDNRAAGNNNSYSTNDFLMNNNSYKHNQNNSNYSSDVSRMSMDGANVASATTNYEYQPYKPANNNNNINDNNYNKNINDNNNSNYPSTINNTNEKDNNDINNSIKNIINGNKIEEITIIQRRRGSVENLSAKKNNIDSILATIAEAQQTEPPIVRKRRVSIDYNNNNDNNNNNSNYNNNYTNSNYNNDSNYNNNNYNNNYNNNNNNSINNNNNNHYNNGNNTNPRNSMNGNKRNHRSSLNDNHSRRSHGNDNDFSYALNVVNNSNNNNTNNQNYNSNGNNGYKSNSIGVRNSAFRSAGNSVLANSANNQQTEGGYNYVENNFKPNQSNNNNYNNTRMSYSQFPQNNNNDGLPRPNHNYNKY